MYFSALVNKVFMKIKYVFIKNAPFVFYPNLNVTFIKSFAVKNRDTFHER